MTAGATGWQAMGKPDFSQAAKLFYRLPSGLREGMNRSEEKVLIWTLFLTWWNSAHSGRSSALASFSETWIGRKFGKSRWTVGRALVKLEGWNLIKRIRRNPKKDGTFQTNIVALGARLLALIGAVRTQVADKSPCSKTAPQEVVNGYKRRETAISARVASHSSSRFGLTPAREEDWKVKNTEKQGEKDVAAERPRKDLFAFLKSRVAERSGS